MIRLIEWQRQIFLELREIEKHDPKRVDQFVHAMVATLSSWRSVSLFPLGELAEPSDPETAPTRGEP